MEEDLKLWKAMLQDVDNNDDGMINYKEFEQSIEQFITK